MPKRKNKYYSAQLKEQAVKEYLTENSRLEDVCKKYGICSDRQLRNWIKWYNGHKEFKDRRTAGTENYMTKGRKTTEKERAEIVAFCIEHGKELSIDDQNLRSIVSANLFMGTEIRRKRSCRTCRRQRPEQAGKRNDGNGEASCAKQAASGTNQR